MAQEAAVQVVVQGVKRADVTTIKRQYLITARVRFVQEAAAAFVRCVWHTFDGRGRALNMITATLAVLPGNRAYEVVGVAIGIAHIAPGRGTQDIARRQMEAEVGTLGADAIVDVHLHMVSVSDRTDQLAIALTGTAIKFV